MLAFWTLDPLVSVWILLHRLKQEIVGEMEVLGLA